MHGGHSRTEAAPVEEWGSIHPPSSSPYLWYLSMDNPACAVSNICLYTYIYTVYSIAGSLIFHAMVQQGICSSKFFCHSQFYMGFFLPFIHVHFTKAIFDQASTIFSVLWTSHFYSCGAWFGDRFEQGTYRPQPSVTRPMSHHISDFYICMAKKTECLWRCFLSTIKIVRLIGGRWVFLKKKIVQSLFEDE